MRALALVLAVLLGGAASAEEPRTLAVQTALVRTEDGRELAVVGGYWVPEGTHRRNTDTLVRCPAEKAELQRQVEQKPAGVPLAKVALWVGGAVALGYAAAKLSK